MNSSTTDYQRSQDVASDPAGNFVVVWSSYGQDGSDFGIFGQRYDASGGPRGGEFQINSYTTGRQYVPAVDMDAAGNFVVAWKSDGQDGSSYGISARRFDASGVPQGGEFLVNTYTTGIQWDQRVAVDARGAFVIAWAGAGPGENTGVFSRRFDASGTPLGPELRVNTFTTGPQRMPQLDADANGNFVVSWITFSQDGSDYGIFAQRFGAGGTARGNEFQVNTYTTDGQFGHTVALDPVGNFVIPWDSEGQDGNMFGVYAQRYGGLYPAALAVDEPGNRVLEPGETVIVSPSWRNRNGAAQTFAGAASGFTGPGAPTNPAYSIPDAAADYGSVANAGTGSCSATGNCYSMATTLPASRPLIHWDAAFQEDILPVAQGQSKTWTLHVGGSFTDVPASSGFYRFVETILHKGVTGGCTAATYCPAAATTRDAMAVFVLVSREPRGYTPPACAATPMFADVPVSSPYCRWVEELARRGVVSGCGGGNYCPGSPASREQMAVFVLATLDPTLNPPACTTAPYGDVPAASPFCRWILELTNRGVVSGCGGGNYCPTAPVSRQEMSVFLTVTFGLLLYAP